jgi:predicted PolB exonuclease-like 3'-5' exonuclease
MTASVTVWDIETVPDLRGFAAAKGLAGNPDDEVRAQMGDKFPKLIYHSIVCIGALVAQVAARDLLEHTQKTIGELDTANNALQSTLTQTFLAHSFLDDSHLG